MGKPARIQLRDNLARVLRDRIARFGALVESNAVTKSTLDRIIDEEGQSVRLDQLDWLAEALQVEPWQLLHPDFDTALLSEWAMKIARKMDSLPEGVRRRAYSRFAHDVDFANEAADEARAEREADSASAPDTLKPRRLRRVDR